jgi:hypothetical protein
MEKPKLYVSGAISKVPDLNKPLFAKVTKHLRGLGYLVVNPHEVCEGLPAEEWHTCMKRCIAAMVQCDILIMLEGWEESTGATIEYELATQLNMSAFNLDFFLQSL